MGEAPVGGDEYEFSGAFLAHYTQDADVDAVLEVLLPQVLGQRLTAGDELLTKGSRHLPQVTSTRVRLQK
jgi:hypothetical protein